jgi:hypothetical protein
MRTETRRNISPTACMKYNFYNLSRRLSLVIPAPSDQEAFGLRLFRIIVRDVTWRSCLYEWRSPSAVLNNLAGPDTKWEDICCFLCLSPFMVEPVCNGAAV